MLNIKQFMISPFSKFLDVQNRILNKLNLTWD